MKVALERTRLRTALQTALDRLIREMRPEGFWEGELSSSALSTATAVSALASAALPGDAALIEGGTGWLARNQNSDGGWGDTVDSPSNLATTLLSIAAIRIAGADWSSALEKALAYVSANAGDTPEQLVKAIQRVYGEDRTFAVPILANCALAGMVPWRSVPGLPYEMAVFPREWYRLLKLHVVSYALPALIGIGIAIEHHSPSRSPFRRMLRGWTRKAVLSKLETLQPEHGGFLDAAPLTSFVAMSLAGVCGSDQPVVSKCLSFLRQSVREDGSWPIDTNLSVWLTTSSLSALFTAGRMDAVDLKRTGDWIASRQYKSVHPFTGAAPFGWGWTHCFGGVPDGDDTSGAVLASVRLGDKEAARGGVGWLLGLQNSDGGWPTFCRGWGQLPFDRSSPDITSHALRAIRACDPDGENHACRRAARRGYSYLARSQRHDGSWVPLWFGNQWTEGKTNPVFGTGRVLLAYFDAGDYSREAAKGVQYLINVQNPDGGWGGGEGSPSSTEETATAVSALLRSGEESAAAAAARGVDYLVSRVEDGSWSKPAPIGLYFSSLWYSERLYPLIWTVEALGLALTGEPA